jgi:hypothetical protein
MDKYCLGITVFTIIFLQVDATIYAARLTLTTFTDRLPYDRACLVKTCTEQSSGLLILELVKSNDVI